MPSNLQYIADYYSQDVSGLQVDDCFTDKYDLYQVIVKVTGRSVQTYDWLRLVDTSGNQINQTEYAYTQIDWSANTSSFNSGNSNSSSVVGNVGICGTDIAKGSKTIINFYQPYDSSAYTMVEGKSVGWTGNGYGTQFMGVHKAAERTPGFYYVAGSGTYYRIQATVFGVK